MLRRSTLRRDLAVRRRGLVAAVAAATVAAAPADTVSQPTPRAAKLDKARTGLMPARIPTDGPRAALAAPAKTAAIWAALAGLATAAAAVVAAAAVTPVITII